MEICISPSAAVLPESVSFHQCSILICTYMCWYQKDTGEAWETSTQQCSFGYRKALDRKVLSLTVLWFRRLVASLSSWSPYFGRSSDPVRFLVDTVALGEVFVRVRPFSPVSTIPAVLHCYLHLSLVLTRTNGRILITVQKKQSSFGGRGAVDRTVPPLCRRRVIHRIFYSGMCNIQSPYFKKQRYPVFTLCNWSLCQRNKLRFGSRCQF